tara:strand:- start:125 stop:1177 length:1053 start_codon:yes stop_codon:yes gene_type:complete
MKLRDKKVKVIIWGFPLDSHTHSYTHYSLHKAFKHLGHDAYWFHDENYPDPKQFDYRNCLFVTEGFCDGKIPIEKSSTYFVHNAVNPGKYLEKGARLVDIRFNVSEINDDNYNMVLDKESLVKMNDCTFYNPKADDSVLGDKFKTGVTGYEALHTIWATNLLPEEINTEWRFFPREKDTFYFIGTLGGSPALEMEKVQRSLHDKKIKFAYQNPWQNPMSFDENRKYLQMSCVSLDVRGSDHYHTNSGGKLEVHGKPVTGGNHKKIGFIPCRTIKQISYGRLPGTNSKAVKELLGDYVMYNDDEYMLVDQCLQFERNPDTDLIEEAMEHIKNNHTFVNRCKSILSVYHKEV